LKAEQTEVNYKNGGSFAITKAGNEKVVVDNDGRVCVGRTSPRSVSVAGTNRTASVDIDIPAQEDVIIIGNGPDLILNKGGGTVVANNGACDINFGVNGGIAAEQSMFFFIDSDNDSTNRAFHFRRDGENKPGTDSAEMMVIQEDGNVGIGVANPQRPLHISNVMRLQPRSSAPTSPARGDMYVGTDNHIYCYLGGSWKQLDN